MKISSTSNNLKQYSYFFKNIFIKIRYKTVFVGSIDVILQMAIFLERKLHKKLVLFFFFVHLQFFS